MSRGYMLGDPDAYEGVWELYNQSFLQRWKWTLVNLNGFLVLGGLGFLLTFSQSRAWIILRYLILLRKKPLSLDGDTLSEPLEHLTQMRAMSDVLPFIWKIVSHLRQSLSRKLRLQRRNTQFQQDSPVISPLFGATALFNTISFVIMGIAIPVLISEGILGAPLIQSKCLDPIARTTGFRASMQASDTDVILNQFCNGYTGIDSGCGSQFFLQEPKIRQTRSEQCPFQEDICNNNTDPFQITQENITGFDIGLNTKSRVMLNHRVICSPVHLDSFLHHTPGPHNLTTISVRDTNADEHVNSPPPLWLPGYNMSLLTTNRPSRYSMEYFANTSDRYIEPSFQKIRDFTILPDIPERYIEGWGFGTYYSSIHPALRRDDGISFLAVYRAGGDSFESNNPVDDPLFAAHEKCSVSKYCPDSEATALGCLDQFQYCITGSESFCTSWGFGKEELVSMRKVLEKQMDIASLADLWAFYIARDTLSLHHYLRMRQTSVSGNADPFSEIKSDYTSAIWGSGGTSTTATVAKDQWAIEVETWFMKAILEAILDLQLGPRYNIVGPPAQTRDKWDYSDHTMEACRRILFRNLNYTSINWAGFWLTTFLLVLICITSYAVKWFNNTARDILKWLAHFLPFLGKRLILAGKTLKLLILQREWMQFSGRSDRIFQRRTWPSSTRQAPEGMDLEDLYAA